jgi:hypothetical protein
MASPTRLLGWTLPLLATATLWAWGRFRSAPAPLSRADEKQRRKTLARRAPRRDRGGLPA